MRTDDQGFIRTGNDVDVEFPEIFVVGDSFTESLFASENVRFASQFERGVLKAGFQYRVLNGGYSGMTTLHMLGVLTTKLPLLVKRPSKILLVIGQSDVNALSSPGLYWEQSKTVTPFAAPTMDANETLHDWRAAFVQMVTTVVTFAKLQGYDFAITAGLYRNGDLRIDRVLQRTFRNNREAYEAETEKRRFILRTVREIAREHRIPLFDASEEILKRPEYFYDLLHLNHHGQEAYARALTAWACGEWIASKPRKRSWWDRTRDTR